MAEKSRREAFEEMLVARPDDAFVRYALALEYRSMGRHEDALAQFKTLTEKNEGYVATYLMYGQLLNQLCRIEEAQAVLRKGLEVAKRAGNAHACSEITELLESLSA